MSAATAGEEGERLQKLLARAGLGSRRACEVLIAAGRVDGRRRGGDPRHARRSRARARITVDGVPVVVDTTRVYWLLNKPAGYVTTARDPQGRPTVIELVPAEPRAFPVGRLDLDTEGLLLLTNDGELAELLTHPRHGVEKAYLAEVEGVPVAGRAARAARGRRARRRAGACRARAGGAASSDGGSALEIVLKEGRKRIVRRMCAEVGHPVRRLVRTRIGPLTDPKLAPGACRPLTPVEVRALYAAALGGRAATPRLTCDLVRVLALRGATTCDENSKAEVDTKTQRLVEEMLERNAIGHDDLVSIIFTATDDITAEFPATAARALGLGDVPLLCARELGIDARHAAHDPRDDALLRRAAARRAPPRLPRRRAHAPRRPSRLTWPDGSRSSEPASSGVRSGSRSRRAASTSSGSTATSRGSRARSSSARSPRSPRSLDDAVVGADLVVVAVPVGAIAGAVVAALDAGAAVVTDVGSVKAPVVAEVEAARPDASARFVGGHPMAGSEQEGVDGADATLFVGSTWALTPTANTDERAYTLVLRVIRELGAEVVTRHARAPRRARRAREPRAAARGLDADGRRDRQRRRPPHDAAARGGRLPRHDAHRGRASRDLARHPRDEPRRRARRRSTRTSPRCCAPARSSRRALATSCSRCWSGRASARRNLPVGASMATDLVELRVPVPDRPGVIAEVTTLAGRLGVNVADVEIAHSLEGGPRCDRARRGRDRRRRVRERACGISGTTSSRTELA